MYVKATLSDIIVQLELVKALDSTEWSIVFEALQKYFIRDYIISWIKCLYIKIHSGIQNGYGSKWYKAERGMTGDPVSGLLFFFCVDVMGCIVRENEHI